MAIGLAGFAFLGAALGAVLSLMLGGADWVALGVLLGANIMTALAAAVRLWLSLLRTSSGAQSQLA